MRTPSRFTLAALLLLLLAAAWWLGGIGLFLGTAIIWPIFLAAWHAKPERKIRGQVLRIGSRKPVQTSCVLPTKTGGKPDTWNPLLPGGMMWQMMFRSILLLLLAPAAWGATYYVSFTNGADTRSAAQAQNSATPWQHHPDSSLATSNSAAQTLAANDIVAMKCGDTWYNTTLTTGEAGSAGSPITTTSYGTGAKPCIVAGRLLNSGWADGDADGEYTQALTTQTYLVYLGASQLVEGTAGSLNEGEWDWAANVIYIRLAGDANPNGQTIEASTSKVLQIAHAYRTYDNLTLRFSNDTTGGVAYAYGGTNPVIEDCTIQYPRKYGIRFNNVASGTVRDCTLTNSTLGSHGVYITGTSTGTTVDGGTVSGFTAYQVYFGSATCVCTGATLTGGQYGIGFVASDNGECSDCTISGSTLYGVTLSNSDGCSILRNAISDIWDLGLYDTGNGIGVGIGGSSEANIIKYNQVVACYQGIVPSPATGLDGNVIAYNIVVNAKVNGITTGSQPEGANPIEINNNVVIHWPILGNDGNYHGHGLALQGSCYKGNIYNNIVYVPTLTLEPTNETLEVDFVSLPENAANSIGIDNNLYYCETPGQGVWRYNLTRADSLAAWQAALAAGTNITGEDASAGTADPLFTNAAGGVFTLLPGSTCIDTGTNLGTAYELDYAGKNQNLAGMRWEIGAYAYFPPVSPLQKPWYEGPWNWFRRGRGR